jgi:hypothetical protein
MEKTQQTVVEETSMYPAEEYHQSPRETSRHSPLTMDTCQLEGQRPSYEKLGEIGEDRDVRDLIFSSSCCLACKPKHPSPPLNTPDTRMNAICT